MTSRSKTARIAIKARESTGLTQARFGKLFDASQPLVSGWEDGSRKPTTLQIQLMERIDALIWYQELQQAVAFWIGEGNYAFALFLALGGPIPMAAGE